MLNLLQLLWKYSFEQIEDDTCGWVTLPVPWGIVFICLKERLYRVVSSLAKIEGKSVGEKSSLCYAHLCQLNHWWYLLGKRPQKALDMVSRMTGLFESCVSICRQILQISSSLQSAHFLTKPNGMLKGAIDLQFGDKSRLHSWWKRSTA